MSQVKDANEVEGIKAGKELKDLEYPLNNPDDYKGRLVFTVVEEPETDLGNVADAAAKFTESVGDDIKEAIGTENPEDVAKAKQQHKGLTNIPIIKDRPLIDTGRRVSLYLPVGLQYRDNVAYDNMDLGGMGGAAESGLKSGSGAISAMVDNFKSTLSAGLGGAANKDVAKLAAVKLTSNLPDEVSGAFKSAAGVTTNPNTRVLFKSVALREFAFAFKFIATSPAEAEEIKEIIKLFRTELYPENINLTVGNSEVSIGYKFPNKFQINVEYDGDEIATRIKPCYLRDVGVTYNNTAMSMHADGNFNEIEMTLSFQESRTLNRKDVEEGGF
tara:strand:- start:19126 stop:20115 length:990 start_codon:yes stop_codon:yes gene_type:complete